MDADTEASHVDVRERRNGFALEAGAKDKATRGGEEGSAAKPVPPPVVLVTAMYRLSHSKHNVDNLLAWVRNLLQHVAAPIVTFYADERDPRDAAQAALRARLAQMRPAALHLTLCTNAPRSCEWSSAWGRARGRHSTTWSPGPQPPHRQPGTAPVRSVEQQVLLRARCRAAVSAPAPWGQRTE